MTIQTRIDAAADPDLERLRGFISDRYGERGNVMAFEAGAVGEFANTWEDRRAIHERYLPVSLPQILAIMPRLRSERWVECLGLGKSLIFGIGSGDLRAVLFANARLFMRERLQMADRTDQGYLLTCDHRVYDRSLSEPVLEIRLKWLHHVKW